MSSSFCLLQNSLVNVDLIRFATIQYYSPTFYELRIVFEKDNALHLKWGSKERAHEAFRELARCGRLVVKKEE